MSKRGEPTFPTFWRLQAAGWTGLYLLVLASALPYAHQRTVMVWRTTLGCSIWFLGSCLLRPLCRSLLQRTLPWLQLEIRTFAWCSLIGTAAAFLIQLMVVRFRQLDWTDLISNSLRSTILLSFWCNLYFSIKQWQRLAEERERLAQAEIKAREARLSALRYQLNPHFLFNSLNAVSTLVLAGDVPAATRMLAQIADLLRISLDKQLPWEVPLFEEMAFTKRYLAIEQTRLGKRLRVDLAVAAETLDAAVPSMLLQPLVENAIRHGVAPVIGGGSITIRSSLCDSQLKIVIVNTGPRDAKPRGSVQGIGLTNTADRLQTLYGTNHKLDLEWPETGGCKVLIEIPFRRNGNRVEGMVCAY